MLGSKGRKDDKVWGKEDGGLEELVKLKGSKQFINLVILV
jgi:hypothetical protein